MINKPNESFYFDSSNFPDDLNELRTPRIHINTFFSNPNQNEKDFQEQNNINKDEKDVFTNEFSIPIKTKPETNSINEESLPETRIVNVVSMFSVECQLNLQQIALQCQNAEYNPKRLNAVIMRIKEPRSVALIFYTGKCICTGTKNEADAEKAARIFTKILKKIGFQVKFKNFKIINMVSTCDLHFPLNLTKLSCKLALSFNKYSDDINSKKRIYYEPEIFPGLIFRMLAPDITLLIFTSGKINFVGVKKRSQIMEALKKVYSLLLEYKVKEFKQVDSKEVEKDFNFMENNEKIE